MDDTAQETPPTMKAFVMVPYDHKYVESNADAAESGQGGRRARRRSLEGGAPCDYEGDPEEGGEYICRMEVLSDLGYAPAHPVKCQEGHGTANAFVEKF